MNEQGLYVLWCFNALSADQQKRLVEWGNLPFGYKPEGDQCSRPAQVGIEVGGDDQTPGPRFYCFRCGIEYIKSRMPTVAEVIEELGGELVDNDNQEEWVPTHLSVGDGSPAKMLIMGRNGTCTMENENGDVWSDLIKNWKRIRD